MQNITMEGIEETRNSLKPVEKPNQEQNNGNKKNGFDKKNYLNDRLEKDQDKKELIIRLLPIDKDSKTPFKIIRMHNVNVPAEIAESGWKKYVCLSETKDIDHEKYGNKCPFCELRYEAFKRAKDESLDKGERNKWYQLGKDSFPHDICIIRCIERGHEEDGPKFWKFTIKKDGTDPYNLITNLNDTRREEKKAYGLLTNENWTLYDVLTGKDLKIIITKEKQEQDSKAKATKRGISIMDYGPEGPASLDQTKIEQWVNDEKKWSDVFAIKPYDYLSIVLDGEIPFFNKDEQKWVVKEKKTESNEKEVEGQAEKANDINKDIEKSVPTSNLDNSDLPF